MPRRTTDYRGLTEQSRVRLLHAVQRAPARCLKDLAAEAAVHINTARDHLGVLEAEGFVFSAPVETGKRGRPPMGYWPVQRSEHSPTAQERIEEAGARGDMLRRIAPEVGYDPDLAQPAQHQLDVLYEHLDDAGMEPVIDSENLTVQVKPCVYQNLLDADCSEVCSVHAKLVRQQLEHVDGPLELRRLHPFTTQHSCLLVLADTEDALSQDQDSGAEAPGISADQSDANLESFARAALQQVVERGGEPSCQVSTGSNRAMNGEATHHA